MRNPDSNIHNIIRRLRKLGYQIDMKNVFESDSRAEKAMKIFEDFEKETQKPWKTDYFN